MTIQTMVFRVTTKCSLVGSYRFRATERHLLQDSTLMHDTNIKSQFTCIKLLSVIDFRKQSPKTHQQVQEQGFTMLLGQ